MNTLKYTTAFASSAYKPADWALKLRKVPKYRSKVSKEPTVDSIN